MRLFSEKLQDYAARLTLVQLYAVAFIATACAATCTFFLIINPQHKHLIVCQHRRRHLEQAIFLTEQKLAQRRLQVKDLHEEHEMLTTECMSMNVHDILQNAHRLLYQQQAIITAASLGEIKQHTSYWTVPLHCKLQISFEQILRTLTALQSTNYCMAMRELTVIPAQHELIVDMKLKLYGRTN